MTTYSVVATPLLGRLLGKLIPHHPELLEVFGSALDILKTDPYNLARKHLIRKLRGAKPGESQYRLRIGRWRFRYDIWDERQEVELSYCGLRREDTYK